MSNYDELKKKWRDYPGKIGISYQDTCDLIQAADTEIERLNKVIEEIIKETQLYSLGVEGDLEEKDKELARLMEIMLEKTKLTTRVIQERDEARLNEQDMEWIDVNKRMPEPGKKVIAYYKNRSGKGRQIIAHYLPRYFAESDAEADSYDEYHEETDAYYYHEGWWEQADNWDDFSCIYVNEGKVTEWQPLPEPPQLPPYMEDIMEDNYLQFNDLTPAQSERLYLLLEEAGEVVQAVGKILRHGYDSTHPDGGPDNRENLEKEIGDFLHAIDRLTDNNNLDLISIEDARDSKSVNVEKYLHHDLAFNHPLDKELARLMEEKEGINEENLALLGVLEETGDTALTLKALKAIQDVRLKLNGE